MTRKQDKGNGKASRLGVRLKAKRYSEEERRSLEGKIVDLAISGELRSASHDARRRQRELGIAVTQKEGSKVVKVHPDGTREVLARVESPRYVLPDGVVVLGEP